MGFSVCLFIYDKYSTISSGQKFFATIPLALGLSEDRIICLIHTMNGPADSLRFKLAVKPAYDLVSFGYIIWMDAWSLIPVNDVVGFGAFL